MEKSIVNEKGQRVVVPMTDEEIADYEMRTAELLEKKEIEKNKIKLKKSAIAKLVDLGLTEDEAKAFLG